jgi:multisubunit Na+/H+ antiporter MnhB subunit
VLIALLIGFAGSMYTDPEMLRIDLSLMFEFWPGVLLGIIICATALMMPMVQARVIRVLVLGACGFSVVGMYLLLQAPDLALTQVMFELISVILFVLVLRMLPTPDHKNRPSRSLRMIIGASVGIMVGWMTLLATQASSNRVLGPFFDANSHHGTEITGGRGGGGDNIVNVVLVDFRGFDTLGEITVLALAALAVWSLLPRIRKTISQNRGPSSGGHGGPGGGQPAIGNVPVRDPDHQEATP